MNVRMKLKTLKVEKSYFFLKSDDNDLDLVEFFEPYKSIRPALVLRIHGAFC